MRIIHYSETEKLLHSYAASYNKKLVRTKDANGRLYIPGEFMPIRGSELKTAMALVHILSRYQYECSHLGIEERRTWLYSCLPALSNKTGYSMRTIQRHIVKLIKADIITEKINKPARPINGKFRYQPFELIINKQLIVYKSKLDVNQAQDEANEAVTQVAQNERVEKAIMTERPNIQSKKLKEVNSTSGVSVLATSNSEVKKTYEGNKTGHAHKLIDSTKKAAKQYGVPGSNERHAVFVSFCAQLAALLWQFSRARLYLHYEYIAPKEREHAISFFFDLLNQESNEKHAKAVFNDYLSTLEQRAKWMEKKPDRLNKIKRPSEYFTANGFLQSYTFWKANKVKYKNEPATFEDSITAVERKIINNYLREPGLRNYMAAVKRLSKIEIPGALDRFNLLVKNRIAS